MGLEDFIPSEGMDAGAKSAEISEKFKESVKKSSAGIKRVQKDEKKAKKYDLLLAHFLVEIIRNPKYDFLLKDLFGSLDHGFPSNFLLGILSLIHVEISDYIRGISGKTPIDFHPILPDERKKFSADNIDTQIQKRINFWIEDVVDVLSLESSTLQIQNMLEMMENNAKGDVGIYTFTSLVFQFFFEEMNIELSFGESQSYCEFILGEVFKKIKHIPLEEV